MTLRAELTRAIAEARDRAIAAGALSIPDGIELPPIGLERPAHPEHGDWASNAAMQLAPVARMAPMKIADALLAHLERPPAIGEVEAAAPGFLNIRLDPAWVASQVGPLVDKQGLDKVASHVDDAVSKGATAVVGGRRKDGLFFEPTLLTGVRSESRVTSRPA